MNAVLVTEIASADAAFDWIWAAIAAGEFEKEADSYWLARKFRLDEGRVRKGWADRRRKDAEGGVSFGVSAIQPREESGAGLADRLAAAIPEKVVPLKPKVAEAAAVRMRGLEPTQAKPKPAPQEGPTEEEQQALVQNLAELYDEPLKYEREKKVVAEMLGANQETVHRMVMHVRKGMPKVGKEEELGQASKAVVIGIKQELWRSSDMEGYATVRQAGHLENYKIRGTPFEMWLRQEYSRLHQVRVGDELLPQVPAASAVRDALAQLEGQAVYGRNAKEFQPAVRVGGGAGEIWIDLGDPDWRAVKVTPRGWEVVREAGVRFIRPKGMLALPVPVRGGNVRELAPLLNIREDDFVLAAGWQQQALNPEGAYPIAGVSGPSGQGKTMASRLLLSTVDPHRRVLRARPRSTEDLLVIAKNNWTLGFDNFWHISPDMSDTLCMLCTEIATGKRANYTDDEEAGFVVRRPLLFNGIPAELGSRSDLLSRTIRFQLPDLKDEDRRLDDEMKAAFAAVWPRVFGSLLDGLVAGLKGGVWIEKRARMADFEAFAEAGCRGMGFADGEFERAYRANREAQMRGNIEGSLVGKMMVQMMKSRQGHGWAGQMRDLLRDIPKPQDMDLNEAKKWPSDATRLSTALRGLKEPLKAMGIEVAFNVDRRPQGSQDDVVIACVPGGLWQKGR